MGEVKLTVSTVNSVNVLADPPKVSDRVNSLDCQALATRETPKGTRLQGEHRHDGEYAQHSDNLALGPDDDGDGEF